MVHYIHELFTMMRKKAELDTVEVSRPIASFLWNNFFLRNFGSLHQDFLQHICHWQGKSITETIVNHAATYERW